MRIFTDPIEMVKEVERDLGEMGIRVQSSTMQDKDVHDDPDYATLELQAYGYTLTGYERFELGNMINYLDGNIDWAEKEFQDRIKSEYINPGEAYLLKEKTWDPFLRDGQFAYTYNERFREQLDPIIRELTLRPTSRQAIVTMYDRHQDMNNLGGKDRIPCSMYYQFYIRDEKLHLIYTMRSCDFLTHFVHDVYMAIRLQEYMAEKLDLPVGNFTHFMGSLHAYQKDIKERNIF